MSNFSFSNSVFKRLVLQTRKNQGLFEKEIKNMGRVGQREETIWSMLWKNAHEKDIDSGLPKQTFVET